MGIVSRTQNDTVSSPRIIGQTWALHRDPVRPPVDRLSALKVSITPLSHSRSEKESVDFLVRKRVTLSFFLRVSLASPGDKLTKWSATGILAEFLRPTRKILKTFRVVLYEGHEPLHAFVEKIGPYEPSRVGCGTVSRGTVNDDNDNDDNDDDDEER
uniref:Uncharacterized protein n=1 Tax=Vespula pensylvanica TaxID=30213 RepID=A0A834KR85_VESPE|nr:hypothetical protein H0235_013662 [Vespula pensylvanica]